MRHRVGILLGGCGAYDGTDPHEATLLILALQERGCDVVPLALERPQFHTVDHATGQESAGQERDQFVESARLVRGKLYPISEISPKLLDALVLPGGQGTAKNFMSGFGTLEAREVVPELAAFLRGVHEAGGIIAAVSLAEFLVSESDPGLRKRVASTFRRRRCSSMPRGASCSRPATRKLQTFPN